MRSLILCVLFLFLVVGASAQDLDSDISKEAWYMDTDRGMTSLHFESSRDEDRFLLEGNSLRILSSRGIGRVTITSESEWPEELRVRFEYAGGQGMKVLEGLFIRRGEERLKGPKPELNHGALEIVLSLGALEPQEALMIHWVDFYR